MKNKLRLLLFEDCNRNCSGCCNKQFDLKALPIENNFSGYDEIILTGGEPMLKPKIILETIWRIREQNNSAKIILYTAKVDDWFETIFILNHLNGITITLHEQEDVEVFLKFDSRLPKSFYQKSLRLNIFKRVTFPLTFSQWKIKDNIEWIENCPLPGGEIFKKLFKGEIK